MSIINLVNINKSYGKNSNKTNVLSDFNFQVEKGEMVAIMGPSGCGKSTLLNILGCIDHPDNGNYFLDGEEINFKNMNKLSNIRNQQISFIFQNFALIKEFTVMENIIFPLRFRKMKYKDKINLATKYLKELGIYDLRNNSITELSGGQQQRVAIARSLTQETNIILADEPTGALDRENSDNIMKLLKDLNKNFDKTIIIVTHDDLVSSFCDRVISL